MPANQTHHGQPRQELSPRIRKPSNGPRQKAVAKPTALRPRRGAAPSATERAGAWQWRARLMESRMGAPPGRAPEQRLCNADAVPPPSAWNHGGGGWGSSTGRRQPPEQNRWEKVMGGGRSEGRWAAELRRGSRWVQSHLGSRAPDSPRVEREDLGGTPPTKPRKLRNEAGERKRLTWQNRLTEVDGNGWKEFEPGQLNPGGRGWRTHGVCCWTSRQRHVTQQWPDPAIALPTTNLPHKLPSGAGNRFLFANPGVAGGVPSPGGVGFGPCQTQADFF